MTMARGRGFLCTGPCDWPEGNMLCCLANQMAALHERHHSKQEMMSLWSSTSRSFLHCSSFCFVQ